MTILVCKGTKLQHEIATVLTDIAQIISIEGPDPEVESFNAAALDTSGAGIPMKPTGQVQGGSVSFEMFLDPGLAGHKDLTAQLTTPASTDWAIVFSDSTSWPFAGILKTLSPAVDLADGLKASGEIELDGIVTYPA